MDFRSCRFNVELKVKLWIWHKSNWNVLIRHQSHSSIRRGLETKTLCEEPRPTVHERPTVLPVHQKESWKSSTDFWRVIATRCLNLLVSAKASCDVRKSLFWEEEPSLNLKTPLTESLSSSSHWKFCIWENLPQSSELTKKYCIICDGQQGAKWSLIVWKSMRKGPTFYLIHSLCKTFTLWLERLDL